MQIELWGSEFSKRKNSTKIPTIDGVIKEVVLKENCSVFAPSFFVTGAVGYGYLKAWDNYYWITNIGFDINGAEYIDCRIDTLASWRTVISNSTFFVERCADATYYNTDIFDDALSIEDGAEITSSANTNIFDSRGGSYLVTVLGRSSTGLNTYVFDNVPGGIFNPLYDIGNNGSFDDSVLEQLNTAVDGLTALFKSIICNPSDYIIAVKFSPLPSSFYPGNTEMMYIGWWESGYSAKKLPMSTYWVKNVSIAKPTNQYSDFRRTDSRCSMYNIYLPGVGTVDLTPDVIEFNLSAEITMSVQTGDIHYNLKAGNSTIGTYDGSIYSDIGFGGSSVKASSVVQTAGGAIGMATNAPHKVVDVLDIENTTSSLEFADKRQGMRFMASLATTVLGVGELMRPQASLASPLGSSSSIWGDPDIRVSAIQKHTADFATDDYGRPCCKNLQLGNLSGFVKCGNASINIASINGIREEINTFLNTGFFME